MLTEPDIIRVTLQNDFVVLSSSADLPADIDKRYSRKLSDASFDDEIHRLCKFFKKPEVTRDLISEDLLRSKKKRSGYPTWHLVSKLRVEITEGS